MDEEAELIADVLRKGGVSFNFDDPHDPPCFVINKANRPHFRLWLLEGKMVCQRGRAYDLHIPQPLENLAYSVLMCAKRNECINGSSFKDNFK